MKCKYMKPKINKGTWCTRDDIRCTNCNNKEYDKPKSKVLNNKSFKKQPIKGKKHKLTKATDIPKKIKLIVWERDKHKCIFCHTPVTWHYANSHYIKRSHSGLGIEPKNIMTNCYNCHKLFEESKHREEMKEIAKNHFKEKYTDWKEEDLVYKKY